jgi:hypothetical protein
VTVLFDGDSIGIAADDGVEILVRRSLMLSGIERTLHNIMCLSVCVEVYAIHCEALRKDLCHT